MDTNPRKHRNPDSPPSTAEGETRPLADAATPSAKCKQLRDAIREGRYVPGPHVIEAVIESPRFIADLHDASFPSGGAG